MDGTADGSVVTVTPEPVVAGGGAAEAGAAEVGAAEVVAVVDSPKLKLKRARRPQRCGLLWRNLLCRRSHSALSQ